MSHLALLKHETQAIKNPPPTFQTVSQKLSKKSGQPQNERVEAYETEQRGLISLRYDGDFCA